MNNFLYNGDRTVYIFKGFAFLTALLLVLSLLISPAFSQGTRRDNGHAEINGNVIFGAWNFDAGQSIPKNFNQHPEFLPNLTGWDFRINLPYTQFRVMSQDTISEPTIIGVQETLITNKSLEKYGHLNNSLWIFRIAESDKKARFLVLPSRRQLPENSAQNVSSLTNPWPSIEGPNLLRESPAATVVGEYIGAPAIYLAARAENGDLQFTHQTLGDNTDTVWPNNWSSLGLTAASAPALASTANGKVVLAFLDPKSERVKIRLFSPDTNIWNDIGQSLETSKGRPQLVWDGVSLNVFYIRKSNGLLRHSVVDTENASAVGAPKTALPLVSVKDDHFDVVRFNQRLHAVARHDAGPGNPTRLFYSSTISKLGEAPIWAIPSEVGFTVRGKPEIAFLNDNLFAIGIGTDGRVRYARKDPNRLGNALTGGAFSDKWLQPGLPIDQASGFTNINSISFNSDIYLVGQKFPLDDVRAPTNQIINFSRAAMKQLITEKHGIRLLWGEPGAGVALIKRDTPFAEFNTGPSRHPFLPKSGDVPLIGDFNGDGKDDLIKFSQRKVNDSDGPAPVYVSLAGSGNNFGDPTLWHRFFSLKGEIPLVGDFNNDGMDDIATFAQDRQEFADGTLLGNAPVWVALSDGSKFQKSRVWHTFFSLKGEIPMVGDFNGDGRDDIATFVQKSQNHADGSLLGNAPVWVALSNGAKFQKSRVWHTFFSLKGEIPMVGDFNGDGRDDIVTFVQRRQNNANGSILGTAPVWVALSNGSKFQQSSVWHTFFSPSAELPRVGDLNLDGKDDIVTFVRDQSANANRKRNIYVSFSNGARFDRATVWHSDYVGNNQLPLIGGSSNFTLETITLNADDGDKKIPGIYAFGAGGTVHLARGLGNVPMPSGAPWEHYKWFNEKGIGMAMFPEWIWDGPNGCLGADHRFALLGAAGSGGATLTNHSVRIGGREGHVLQEVGHSIFANCFQENSDPFNQWKAIFSTQPLNGVPGINATAKPFCPLLAPFYDCRDPEHYFLGLMVRYRVEGDRFREKIDLETNPFIKLLLQRQYDWFKTNWYSGAEFKTGLEYNANYAEVGVSLLPEDATP